MNPKSIPKRVTSWVQMFFASVLLAATAQGQITVTNTTPITIRDNNTADPFPSTISVSNYVGGIKRIIVSLNKVSHPYPDDIDVLLVSPSGDQVLLVSDAGGQFDLNGVDLKFDSFAQEGLPDESQIVSGVFAPTNYEPADNFPGVAANVTQTLGFGPLIGDDPNTPSGSPNQNWKLYVVDDQITDSGSISSWSLTFYMSPVLTVTNLNVTTPEDTATNIVVKVADTDTPLENLVLGRSFDTNFIADVVFTGTGADRIAQIIPAANANTAGGPTTPVTITLADGLHTNSVTVNVTITASNDGPQIAGLQTGSTTIPLGGLSTNINIRVTDIDTDTNLLRLVAISTNNAIVSGTNVYFGGTGTNRNMRIASSGAAVGTVTLTILVIDPVGPLTNTANITVTVTNNNAIYRANNAPIVVADNTTVISTNTITGVSGAIGEVEVILLDVEHINPSDLSVLLVGPNNEEVVLTRGAGNGFTVSNTWLRFKDGAASLTGAQITSGVYDPTDLGAGSIPGAPVAPYNADLSVFDNINAVGDWRLYVNDAANNGGAAINGGWILNFAVGPTLAGIGATNITDEDKQISIPFTVGDQDGSPSTVTITAPSDPNLYSVAIQGTGASRTLVITPIVNVYGEGNLLITATDADGYTTNLTTRIIVNSINDKPTISPIPKLTTRAGQPVSTNFTVLDADQIASSLVLSATTLNNTLLPPGSIQFGGSGSDRTITIYPTGSKEAFATVTVRVTDPDGGWSETTFDFTVLPAGNRLFEKNEVINIPDPSVAGTSTSVVSTNTITDLNGSIADIEISLFKITHPAPQHLDILLVSPTGTNIVLISDVGGSTPVTNQTLVFRASGSNVVGSLVSGIYAPVNGGPNGDTGEDPSAEFADIGGSRTTTLSDFAGTDPKGAWRLVVRDDTKDPRGGVIEGGWLLSIRTRPNIQAINPVTMLEDASPVTVAVPFSDDQPGVVYTFSSSIAPVGATTSNVVQIATEQKGGTVNVTITPYLDAFGTNDVTLSVTDGVNSSVRIFQVRVQAVADNPRITGLAATLETTAATLTQVSFAVFDPETANQATIPVSVTSDKTTLIPSEYISPAVANGTNRTFSFVSRGTLTGSANLTVVVGNDAIGRTTNNVLVTVNANAQALSNTGQITIPAQGDASPFPSQITVNSGDVQGKITGVSVILDGFTHTFPDDVDVMLVSPNNVTNVLLMSDSGGGGGANSVSNLRLAFSAGGSALPDTSVLTNGNYLPTNNNDVNEVGESLAGLSSAAFNTDITKLYSLNPVGTWSLYVRDDAFPDGGTINNGWILLFQTAPQISQISTQTFNEDTEANVPFTIVDGDTPKNRLGVTATVDTGAAGITAGLLVDSNLVVTATDSGFNLRIRPTTNLFGESSVMISVVDSNTPAASPVTTTFRVKVSPVNDAPIITTVLTNLVFTANEETAVAITYTISDVDSVLKWTNLTVTSANLSLIPSSNIVITAGPAVTNGMTNVTVTFTPLPDRPIIDAIENSKITVVVNDYSSTAPANQTATNVVTIEIKQVNDAPKFSTTQQIPAIVTVEVGATTTNIVFGISDVETPARDLVITNVTSSVASIVPTNNVIFGFGSSGDTRTVQITPVGDQTGDVTIGFVLRDLGATGDATAKETPFSFVVRVVPLQGTIFANSARIGIPDSGAGNPYPSTNTVAGLVGPINRVFVTLDGVTHPNPDDLDILLVSPSGGKVLLMSDAGGTTDLINLRLQFSDNGRALPDEGTIVGGTNVYQASNYEGSGELNEVLATPAPAGPYLRSLGDLKGESTANGQWKLYVFDDTAQHSGEIAFGWSLRIVTAPSVALDGANSTLSVQEDNVAVIALDVADGTVSAANFATQLNVALEVGNPVLTPLTNITYSWDVSGNLTVNVRPGTNEWGTNTVTVTVSRGDVSTSRQVTVGFSPVDDLPQISRLADAITTEEDPIWLPVQIIDPDTALSALRIEAITEDTNFVSATNITFVVNDRASGGANPVIGLATNRYFLRIQPNTNRTTNDLLVTLRAGYTNLPFVATSTASFDLDILEDNDLPTISSSTNSLSVISGATASFTVTVADPENDAITVTAASSNSKVVRTEDITVTGSGGTRTIAFLTQPGQVGQTANITVSATDSQPGHSPVQTVVLVTLEESRERVFPSTGPSGLITINDATVNGGRATPFGNADGSAATITIPSTGNDSLVGAISKVVVTLHGFTHSFPDDVDVLLVGPQGQKVVLMSDAGGNTRATNLTLRFEQGQPVIPDSALASGTYSPTNYEGSSDNFFEAPAGAIAPESQGLNVFIGTSPVGTWRLFVVDDTPSDNGQIAQGWSLAITTGPRILSLPDLTIGEDQAGTNLLVLQEESFINAGNIVVTILSSSNTTLIATNTISDATGSGLTRSIVLQPKTNQVGTSEITVRVKAPGAPAIEDKFVLTVTNINDAPVIETTIGERLNVVAGGSIRAPFVISDTETDLKNLVITVQSSNPQLVPVNYIRLIDTNILVFADANAVSDIPLASDVVVTVSDGSSATEKRFRVVVDPSRNVVRASNTRMVIPTSGPAADGYPSTINVSNVLGTIIKMTVTLRDVSHTFPDDMDIMLVGPNGTNIVLMSDAGSGGNTNSALVNAWLSFADGGATLPENGPILDKYGTNAPANYEGSPAEEFQGATGVVLGQRAATFATAFNGISPNGAWRLYVYDDSAPDQGAIEGWQISFETTAPTIDFISDVLLAEDGTTNIVFSIADDQPLNAIGISYNTNDLRIVEVTSLTGSSNVRTLSLRALPDASGTDVITITVKDNSGNTVSRSFEVTVFPLNDAPVIAGLLATNTTPANVTLRVPFTVTDAEGSNVVVTVSNSNNSVLTAALSGSNGSYELTVVPNGIPGTNSTVTVVADDGASTVTNTVVVVITEPLGPGLSDIQDVLGTEDQNLQVPFTITKTTSANPALTVSHNNSNLVFSATVSGSGTNRSVILLLVPNANGQATVTVTITDEYGSDSEDFVLTVPNSPDAPTIGAIADRTALEDSSVEIPLSVSDVDTALSNLVFTATSSNTNLVSGVTFRVENGVAIATVNLRPNASGVAAVSISVSDGAGTATSAFALTVTNVDDAPTLGAIESVTVNEDAVVAIALNVADSDSALTSLTFVGTSTDTNLVSGITFTVTSSSAIANVKLATNAFGTNLVTITVSEGTNKVSQSFALTVLEVLEPPVFSPISDIVTNENSVITIPLSVTDPDDSVQNLAFFSSTQGTALVQDIQFSFGDAGSVAAVITLKANAAGSERITLSVSDGNEVARQSFNLEVIAVNDKPVLGAIADQTVTGSSSTAQVIFTVADPDNAINELAFFGSTGTTNIVKEISFEVAGPNAVRGTLTLIPGASGTDRVTFSVNDGENTSRTSFNLTVTPNTTPASLKIAKGAGTALTITATGTPNATYLIEGTSNFNTWTQAGSVTIGASGTGTLTIQNNASYQFFRAKNQ